MCSRNLCFAPLSLLLLLALACGGAASSSDDAGGDAQPADRVIARDSTTADVAADDVVEPDAEMDAGAVDVRDTGAPDLSPEDTSATDAAPQDAADAGIIDADPADAQDVGDATLMDTGADGGVTDSQPAAITAAACASVTSTTNTARDFDNEAPDPMQLAFLSVELSANGQRMVFLADLGDQFSAFEPGGGLEMLFIRDLHTGELRRLNPVQYSIFWTAVSGDGRYVYVHDGGGAGEIQRYDWNDDAFDMSLALPGGQAFTGFIESLDTNYDGSKVAFSTSRPVIPGVTSSFSQLYLWDSGTVTLVSRNLSGMPGSGDSSGSALSSDGTSLVFTSGAGSLVVGDTNNVSDVFVYDSGTSAITRVNVGNAGQQGNVAVRSSPSISGDGRFVAFQTDASLSASGAGHYVHDRQTDNLDYLQPGRTCFAGASSVMSADGRFVVSCAGSASTLIDRQLGTSQPLAAGTFPHISLDGSLIITATTDGPVLGVPNPWLTSNAIGCAAPEPDVLPRFRIKGAREEEDMADITVASSSSAVFLMSTTAVCPQCPSLVRFEPESNRSLVLGSDGRIGANMQGVWAGTALFVHHDGGDVFIDGNTGVQTPVAGGPGALTNYVMTWTGQEVHLAGTSSTGSFVHRSYSPTTNAWRGRSAASAPLIQRDPASIWTGTHWYAGNNGGAVYDPTTDAWTLLNTGLNLDRHIAALHPAGEVFLYDGRRAFRLDFASNSYQPFNAPMTMTSVEGLVWARDRLLAFTETEVAVYDPVVDGWSSLSYGAVPSLRDNGAVDFLTDVVSAGDEVVLVESDRWARFGASP